MKAHVAIYKSEEQALNAIELLSEKSFAIDKVSMIKRIELTGNKFEVKSIKNFKMAPLLISTLLGMLVGIFAPLFNITFGLDFMEDLSPVIGGFVGFDIGLLVGALLLIIIAIIIKRDKTIETHNSVEEVNYVIVVEGTLDDIKLAENILNTVGVHQYKLECTYCQSRKIAPKAV